MGRAHDNLNYHGPYDDHGRISDKIFYGSRGNFEMRPTAEEERFRPPNGLDSDQLEYYRDTANSMEYDNLRQRRIIESVD